MILYEAWFEGEAYKSLEIELPNTNTISIIHDGRHYLFWGGRTPRPWNVKGKRMRKMIYNSDCKNLYQELFNEVSTTVRKLSGLDKEIWPWWAEMHRVMSTMRTIEQRGGSLWENSTNESYEIFRTYIPRQGGDETLTKLMVACGFGFNGTITQTTDADITGT